MAKILLNKKNNKNRKSNDIYAIYLSELNKNVRICIRKNAEKPQQFLRPFVTVDFEEDGEKFFGKLESTAPNDKARNRITSAYSGFKDCIILKYQLSNLEKLLPFLKDKIDNDLFEQLTKVASKVHPGQDISALERLKRMQAVYQALLLPLDRYVRDFAKKLKSDSSTKASISSLIEAADWLRDRDGVSVIYNYSCSFASLFRARHDEEANSLAQYKRLLLSWLGVTKKINLSLSVTFRTCASLSSPDEKQESAMTDDRIAEAVIDSWKHRREEKDFRKILQEIAEHDESEAVVGKMPHLSVLGIQSLDFIYKYAVGLEGCLIDGVLSQSQKHQTKGKALLSKVECLLNKFLAPDTTKSFFDKGNEQLVKIMTPQIRDLQREHKGAISQLKLTQADRKSLEDLCANLNEAIDTLSNHLPQMQQLEKQFMQSMFQGLQNQSLWSQTESGQDTGSGYDNNSFF